MATRLRATPQPACGHLVAADRPQRRPMLRTGTRALVVLLRNRCRRRGCRAAPINLGHVEAMAVFRHEHGHRSNPGSAAASVWRPAITVLGFFGYQGAIIQVDGVAPGLWIWVAGRRGGVTSMQRRASAKRQWDSVAANQSIRAFAKRMIGGALRPELGRSRCLGRLPSRKRCKKRVSAPARWCRSPGLGGRHAYRICYEGPSMCSISCSRLESCASSSRM